MKIHVLSKILAASMLLGLAACGRSELPASERSQKNGSPESASGVKSFSGYLGSCQSDTNPDMCTDYYFTQLSTSDPTSMNQKALQSSCEDSYQKTPCPQTSAFSYCTFNTTNSVSTIKSVIVFSPTATSTFAEGVCTAVNGTYSTTAP